MQNIDFSTYVQMNIFTGELRQEKVLRQIGPSAQKTILVVLNRGIVILIESVAKAFSADVTTAKTSMQMLTG